MAKAGARQSLADISGTLVMIGAGKMGGPMLHGWLARDLDPKRTVVIEPKPSGDIEQLTTLGVTLNPDDAEPATVLVIAVKPQSAPEVMPTVKRYAGPSTLAISIMAGRDLQFLADELPLKTAIVRAMPNTPAAIGRGITVAVPNPYVSVEQRDIAHRLLTATGGVEWIIDERLMDAVTALSGSGPAYVFLLAEALTQAGIEIGLPRALAVKLARETIAGAGEMMHRTRIEAATLRQNVTSPGGTTAAALEVLMDKEGLTALMTKALDAAAKRARELAG